MTPESAIIVELARIANALERIAGQCNGGEKAPRFSKLEILARCNVETFLDQTPGGESRREICRRLRIWCLSKDAPHRLVISDATASLAISNLVHDRKLLCLEGKYCRNLPPL